MSILPLGMVTPTAQLVSMPDQHFHEEIFLNIQSKSPLTQLEAISSSPIAFYLEEEASPHFTTTLFQVVIESSKVSPVPLYLHEKDPCCLSHSSSLIL